MHRPATSLRAQVQHSAGPCRPELFNAARSPPLCFVQRCRPAAQAVHHSAPPHPQVPGSAPGARAADRTAPVRSSGQGVLLGVPHGGRWRRDCVGWGGGGERAAARGRVRAWQHCCDCAAARSLVCCSPYQYTLSLSATQFWSKSVRLHLLGGISPPISQAHRARAPELPI